METEYSLTFHVSNYGKTLIARWSIIHTLIIRTVDWEEIDFRVIDYPNMCA